MKQTTVTTWCDCCGEAFDEEKTAQVIAFGKTGRLDLCRACQEKLQKMFRNTDLTQLNFEGGEK